MAKFQKSDKLFSEKSRIEGARPRQTVYYCVGSRVGYITMYFSNLLAINLEMFYCQMSFW